MAKYINYDWVKEKWIEYLFDGNLDKTDDEQLDYLGALIDAAPSKEIAEVE